MRARLLLVVVALAAMGVTLVIAYDGRVAAGARVAGLELGGLTESDARAKLQGATRDAKLTLVAGGTTFDLDRGAGIDVDVDAAVADAVRVGRGGDLWERGADVLQSVAFGREIALTRRIDDADRFARTIDLVAATVEREVADAAVIVDGTDVRIRNAVTGVALDRTVFVETVLAADGIRATAPLPLRTIAPTVDDEAAASAYAAAKNAALPLVATAGTEQVAIEPARLLSLMRVDRERTAGGDRLVAALEPAGLDALVSEIASSLEGPAREAALVPGDERFGVVPGRDGIVIDRAATRAALAAAIVGADRVLLVPATITHPALSTDAAQRTADTTTLLGGYTTYFPVSWARATNIGAAARTFDGMAVAPGDSFSFWERIGEVSPRTGYVLAGTIIGGVSSEAIGGGLCQVSTTFFNAVAAAGYAIDERHPHSYYIERYPLGLDAAVFAPSTDMRWTNDTPYPAIIRASGTDTSVSFWIYSAPTGRTTAFSEPLQWNVVWPSPSQPADPGHAPGYVVAGRDTSVIRTVSVDGTVIHEDTWYSHYAPVWGGPAR